MTRRIMMTAAILGLALWGLGCDEDKSGQGCVVDSDCRGERVCVEGVCEAPEVQVDVGGGDTGSGGADAEQSRDTSSSGEDVPPGEDTRLPEEDTGPPPLDVGEPPMNLCAEALEHVTSCEGYVFNDGMFGLNWPECATERDACAAECIQDYTCGDLACSFDPDTDCDGVGPFVAECLADCDAEPTCECGTTFDCCAGLWLCYDVNDPPITCDLDCQPFGTPPPCDCNADGVCEAGPEPGNIICGTAIDHLTQDCGYDPESLREDHPRDYALIAQMLEGTCTDPYLTCYANCMAYPVEDECFFCRFVDQSCLRDPFDECIDACVRPPDWSRLCEVTGGTWDDSECANCCGPTLCGDDPEAVCTDDCCGDQQCVCSDDQPFWSAETGCFSAEACFP